MSNRRPQGLEWTLLVLALAIGAAGLGGSAFFKTKRDEREARAAQVHEQQTARKWEGFQREMDRAEEQRSVRRAAWEQERDRALAAPRLKRVRRLQLPPSSGFCASLAFAPDGRFLAAGDGSGLHQVHLWDVRRGTLQLSLSGHNKRVFQCVFSYNGTMLATAERHNLWDDGIRFPIDDRYRRLITLRVWDARNGRLKSIEQMTQEPASVAFSSRERRLLPSPEVAANGAIRLHPPRHGRILQIEDVAGQRTTRIDPAHDMMVESAVVAPNGRVVCSSGMEGYSTANATLKLWDARSGRLRYVLSQGDDVMGNLTFSPDCRLLSTTSNSEYNRPSLRALYVWHVPTGRLLRAMQLPAFASSLAFSKDSRQLAVAIGEVITIYRVP